MTKKSWRLKATKTRPNRAFIWNDTYQQGCLVVWPVAPSSFQAEFELLQPEAIGREIGYEINRGGARYLSIGGLGCIAFGDGRPACDLIAHECYHLMSDVMDGVGVPPESGAAGHEARAYFLQWAIRETLRMMKS